MSTRAGGGAVHTTTQAPPTVADVRAYRRYWRPGRAADGTAVLIHLSSGDYSRFANGQADANGVTMSDAAISDAYWQDYWG